MSLHDPTGPWNYRGMTSTFNTALGKTMVMLMRYHDASTPSLKAQSHDGKLQPLIQYLKDETLPNDEGQSRNLYIKKVNIFSVIMTFYTNNLIQQRKPSFSCEYQKLYKRSSYIVATIISWAVILAWIKRMKAWNLYTSRTTSFQTYNNGSNLVFSVPKRKGMSTTQNHLCYPLPFLGHGKLLPQTVRALFPPGA